MWKNHLCFQKKTLFATTRVVPFFRGNSKGEGKPWCKLGSPKIQLGISVVNDYKWIMIVFFWQMAMDEVHLQYGYQKMSENGEYHPF